jgi:hypothetical protein
MQIGFKHLFKLKAHKLGATLSYHRLRTTTRLTWLIPLSTSDSRTKRSSAQRWRDTNLKGHDTVLNSGRCWKMEKTRGQHGPIMTTYSNRCCLCLGIGIGIRNSIWIPGRSSHYRHWHNQYKHNTNNRKKNSRQWKVESSIQSQKCHLIGSGRKVCLDLHQSWSILLLALQLWFEIRIRTTGWFL